MMFCKHCGQKMTDGAAFCNSCGANQSQVDPQQATPTDPQQATPTDPQQATPTDLQQTTPVAPQQTTPVAPQQTIPVNLAPPPVATEGTPNKKQSPIAIVIAVVLALGLGIGGTVLYMGKDDGDVGSSSSYSMDKEDDKKSDDDGEKENDFSTADDKNSDDDGEKENDFSAADDKNSDDDGEKEDSSSTVEADLQANKIAYMKYAEQSLVLSTEFTTHFTVMYQYSRTRDLLSMVGSLVRMRTIMDEIDQLEVPVELYLDKHQRAVTAAELYALMDSLYDIYAIYWTNADLYQAAAVDSDEEYIYGIQANFTMKIADSLEDKCYDYLENLSTRFDNNDFDYETEVFAVLGQDYCDELYEQVTVKMDALYIQLLEKYGLE